MTFLGDDSERPGRDLRAFLHARIRGSSRTLVTAKASSGATPRATQLMRDVVKYRKTQIRMQQDALAGAKTKIGLEVHNHKERQET